MINVNTLPATSLVSLFLAGMTPVQLNSTWCQPLRRLLLRLSVDTLPLSSATLTVAAARTLGPLRPSLALSLSAPLESKYAGCQGDILRDSHKRTALEKDAAATAAGCFERAPLTRRQSMAKSLSNSVSFFATFRLVLTSTFRTFTSPAPKCWPHIPLLAYAAGEQPLPDFGRLPWTASFSLLGSQCPRITAAAAVAIASRFAFFKADREVGANC